jgi:hypothetical protein
MGRVAAGCVRGLGVVYLLVATTVAFQVEWPGRVEAMVTTPGSRTARKVAVTPRTRDTTPLLTGSSTWVSDGVIGCHGELDWASGTCKVTVTTWPTVTHHVPPASPSVSAASVVGYSGACAGRHADVVVLAELHPLSTLAATKVTASSDLAVVTCPNTGSGQCPSRHPRCPDKFG